MLTSGGTTTYGTQTPTRLWAEHDANYNIVALANNSGTVVERFDFDPYGNSTVLSASFGSTSYTLGADPYQWVYGFQGGRLDPNSGLVHFGARMYNPVTGTWMSQDPAGYVDGANRYQFVGSSPADLVDPAGLADKSPTTNKSSGGSSGGVNTNFPTLPGNPGGAANGPAAPGGSSNSGNGGSGGQGNGPNPSALPAAQAPAGGTAPPGSLSASPNLGESDPTAKPNSMPIDNPWVQAATGEQHRVDALQKYVAKLQSQCPPPPPDVIKWAKIHLAQAQEREKNDEGRAIWWADQNGAPPPDDLPSSKPPTTGPTSRPTSQASS